MSYHFTKGRYRAYVSTSYYDHNDQQQFVNGTPVEFTADPVEYFTFETNENIKVNLDTLEAPNAELEDEGTYKGLSYKLYNNSLAVVSGTQTSAIGENDTTPWTTSEYIYAKVILISGRVFHTAGNCHELQIRDSSFASGATSEYLISNWNSGSYNDYYNVVNIESLDTSNMSDFSSMFAHVRISDSFEGLENLDISNGNDFNEFLFDAQFQTQRRAITLHFDTNRIDPTGTNHKFDRAFSGMICEEDSGEWPYGIFIYVTSLNNKTMFRWLDGMSRDFSHGKLRVFIENSDYITPNMPIDSSYMFYGNKNSGIYLSGFVAPDNCDMSHFFEETSSNYLYFKTETGSDESNSTKLATNMTAFCKNNTHLLEQPRSMSMENCELADEMYYGCSSLGYDRSSYSSYVTFGGPHLVSAQRAFYNAFGNTYGGYNDYLTVYIDIDESSADVNLTSIFERAGGGGHPYTLDILFSGTFNQNKTVNLTNALKTLCMRHVNLRANRDSTGSQYLMPVSLYGLEQDHAWLESINLENLYIRDAYQAFYGNNELTDVSFFNENMGGSPKSYCVLADNININTIFNGLSHSTSKLRRVNTPDNMLNLTTENYNMITMPHEMKYYKNGAWHGNPQTTATVSLASYSTEYPTE